MPTATMDSVSATQAITEMDTLVRPETHVKLTTVMSMLSVLRSVRHTNVLARQASLAMVNTVIRETLALSTTATNLQHAKQALPDTAVNV